jgi:hypothetical protein
LPKPTAKVLMAAIAPIEEFIPLVEKQLDHLAIAAASASASGPNEEAPTDVSVIAEAAFDGEWAWGSAEPVNCLGDGAGWIWRASQELFEQPRETLDFFHGTEAIGKYTRRQHGEGTQTKKARYERGVTLLLTAGYPGICQFITEERQLLDATRKASANDLSATTMLVTMLVSGALTMPTSPEEADAPALTTASPNATDASLPEATAASVRGEFDDDDVEGVALEKALKSKSPGQRIDGLSRYFAKHANRLNYADRLREGRAIGSGMIEGNIKTITLRLKARGARWLLPNVVAMSRLCCLCNSTFWADYWKCPA